MSLDIYVTTLRTRNANRVLPCTFNHCESEGRRITGARNIT